MKLINKMKKLKSISIKGFTLIELLVVISIIAILSSIVLIALNNARSKGTLGSAIEFASHNYQVFGADAVAVYNFNNMLLGDQETLVDSSGNGVNLSGKGAKPASPADSPTGSGNSLVFDLDTADYSTSKIIALNTDFAISVWVKLIDDNNGKLYININNIPQPQIYIYSRGDDTDNSYFYINDQFGSSITIPKFDTKTWHNLVYSADFKNKKIITGWLDGKNIGSLNIGSLSVPASISSILLGGMNASVDDFAIYKHSMTAYQAQEIYAQGLQKHTLASAK